MKKIAVIVNKYYPFIGGTENLAKSIVENLLINEYDVEVITTKHIDRDLNLIKYKINEISLNNSELLNDTLSKYDACLFFADLHSIHLNNYNLSCNKNICVLNIDERTYDLRNNFTNALSNLKKFDKVITFTLDGIANKYLEENKIKNTYIQNFSRDVLNTPTNEEFINKIKNVFHIADRKLIVYPAVFEQRKNQLYVISKLIEQSQLREFNWLFIGPFHESSYITQCMQQSKKLNLPVSFMKGTSDSKKLDLIYQAADLICLASMAEGMPLVLMEALSANKPWVATPVGGIQSVLGNTNTGVVLKNVNFSGNELYESIKMALKLQENNLSRNVWKQNYDEQIVLQKYKKVINEVINDNI